MSTDSISSPVVDAPEQPQDEQTRADFAEIEARLESDAAFVAESFYFDFDEYDAAELDYSYEIDKAGDVYTYELTIKRSIPVQGMEVLRKDDDDEIPLLPKFPESHPLRDRVNAAVAAAAQAFADALGEPGESVKVNEPRFDRLAEVIHSNPDGKVVVRKLESVRWAEGGAEASRKANRKRGKQNEITVRPTDIVDVDAGLRIKLTAAG